MGARACRNNNQFRDRDHALNRHGYGWWRIDDGQLETLLAQYRQIRGKARNRGLRKCRQFGFPLVPPIGQGTLRIDVNQYNRTSPGQLCLHS
tara:strand:- start:442 stop:717 length:276 start_codon:yes stop_codon:yes gene_type:complete